MKEILLKLIFVVVEDYGYFDSFFFWCRTKHLYLFLLFYFVLLSRNVYFLLIN
jgi:hypothetical protein